MYSRMRKHSLLSEKMELGLLTNAASTRQSIMGSDSLMKYVEKRKSFKRAKGELRKTKKGLKGAKAKK